VQDAAKRKFGLPDASREAVSERIERVVVGKSLVQVMCRSEDHPHGSPPTTIEIPWAPKPTAAHVPAASRKPDQKLLQAIVRSRAWLADLKGCRYTSIEELAEGVEVHPKVVRQALRLAFLSSRVTSVILEGDLPEWLTLRQIRKRLPLAWNAHWDLCGWISQTRPLSTQ
jgi:site-specific DNA recombinase